MYSNGYSNILKSYRYLNGCAPRITLSISFDVDNIVNYCILITQAKGTKIQLGTFDSEVVPQQSEARWIFFVFIQCKAK